MQQCSTEFPNILHCQNSVNEKYNESAHFPNYFMFYFYSSVHKSKTTENIPHYKDQQDSIKALNIDELIG